MNSIAPSLVAGKLIQITADVSTLVVFSMWTAPFALVTGRNSRCAVIASCCYRPLFGQYPDPFHHSHECAGDTLSLVPNCLLACRVSP